MSVRFKKRACRKSPCKHADAVKCGYRLRIGVRSKNASVSGFARRPSSTSTTHSPSPSVGFPDFFSAFLSWPEGVVFVGVWGSVRRFFFLGLVFTKVAFQCWCPCWCVMGYVSPAGSCP